MKNLKTFLKYRDENAAFEPIKERGSVGVPCTMVEEGDSYTLIFGKPDLAELR